MSISTARLLPVLLGLNLALQLFDGAATYIGWEEHGEMNPILAAGFASFGAGPTLLVAKSPALDDRGRGRWRRGDGAAANSSALRHRADHVG